MKVRVKYQAFYATDSRGPRIIEPGTIISIPNDQKLSAWMEPVVEPKADEQEQESPKKSERLNDKKIL